MEKSQSQQKRQIENYRGYWIHSERNGIMILATADKNWCDECKQFDWIVNIQNEDKNKKTNIVVSRCVECLDRTILCKPQYCPFSNPSRAESVNICKECCSTLIENTTRLYSTIKENILIS